ncbi:MAG: methionyl-tRNA formyltransferase [Planctomycetota bacterium]|nr:methionyl-tRNA formyltransferase [Planctomycetota bacterium]
MRLVYLGSGEFGLPTLRALVRSHEVAAVVTQPDRPAGRSRKLTPTPVGQWAAEHLPGALLLKPEDVNDPAVVGAIRGVGADAFVVIAFGQKLGERLLEDVLAINLHGSLLPRWRGAAPINHAVLAGDAVVGNSVITLAQTMDAGLVLATSSRALDPSMTAGELHDALAEDGPALVLSVLERASIGTVEGAAQDPGLVTRAGKLRKSDGVVDFGRPAEELRRRVHGLTPWPGVTVRLREESLQLMRVGVEEAGGARRAAGEVVDALGGTVACGNGTVLRILEVKPAGGRVMSWSEFVRGRHVQAGEMLRSGTAEDGRAREGAELGPC